MISSDPTSPIHPAGSPVNLTCTVKLSPLNVPVTVNTVWTGPAEFRTTNTAHPVIGSTTNYTSTVTISPFGREQSGNYVCRATINPDTLITSGMEASGMARITVGKIL